MIEEVRTISATGGHKGVKQARYDLIPSEPLRLLAELYGKGAEKYAERNWENGYEWSKSFAALNRHLWAFWNGEDIDEETGKPHLTCVAFHAFALAEFMQTHPNYDDRPRSPKTLEPEAAVVHLEDPIGTNSVLCGNDKIPQMRTRRISETTCNMCNQYITSYYPT